MQQVLAALYTHQFEWNAKVHSCAYTVALYLDLCSTERQRESCFGPDDLTTHFKRHFGLRVIVTDSFHHFWSYRTQRS